MKVKDIRKRHDEFTPWPAGPSGMIESGIATQMNLIHKDRSELLKRVEELEAQQQWQPIETAPKDKQVFIAFDEPFFGEFSKEINTGYFDSESEKWRFELPDREVLGQRVTHWMPLPDPPEGES